MVAAAAIGAGASWAAAGAVRAQHVEAEPASLSMHTGGHPMLLHRSRCRRNGAGRLPGARSRPGGRPRRPAGLCRVSHPGGECSAQLDAARAVELFCLHPQLRGSKVHPPTRPCSSLCLSCRAGHWRGRCMLPPRRRRTCSRSTPPHTTSWAWPQVGDGCRGSWVLVVIPLIACYVSVTFSVTFHPVCWPRFCPLAEARGDYSTAVASYRLALRLLLARRDGNASVQQPSSVDGSSTSLQTGGWCEVGSISREVCTHASHQGGCPALRCSHSSNLVFVASSSPCPAALQLNLARALTLAGASGEAAQRYEELEVSAGVQGGGGGGGRGVKCAHCEARRAAADSSDTATTVLLFVPPMHRAVRPATRLAGVCRCQASRRRPARC